MSVRFIGGSAFNDSPQMPPERRQDATNPNPGRRSTDGRGPWLVRRQQAADRFEGVSRPTWRRLS